MPQSEFSDGVNGVRAEDLLLVYFLPTQAPTTSPLGWNQTTSKNRGRGGTVFVKAVRIPLTELREYFKMIVHCREI